MDEGSIKKYNKVTQHIIYINKDKKESHVLEMFQITWKISNVQEK